MTLPLDLTRTELHSHHASTSSDTRHARTRQDIADMDTIINDYDMTLSLTNIEKKQLTMNATASLGHRSHTSMNMNIALDPVHASSSPTPTRVSGNSFCPALITFTDVPYIHVSAARHNGGRRRRGSGSTCSPCGIEEYNSRFSLSSDEVDLPLRAAVHAFNQINDFRVIDHNASLMKKALSEDHLAREDDAPATRRWTMITPPTSPSRVRSTQSESTDVSSLLSNRACANCDGRHRLLPTPVTRATTCSPFVSPTLVVDVTDLAPHCELLSKLSDVNVMPPAAFTGINDPISPTLARSGAIVHAKPTVVLEPTVGQPAEDALPSPPTSCPTPDGVVYAPRASMDEADWRRVVWWLEGAAARMDSGRRSTVDLGRMTRHKVGAGVEVGVEMKGRRATVPVIHSVAGRF